MSPKSLAVLDFRTNTRDRSCVSPRQRWRLLGLILGLGFLFIVGEWVVNPEKRRQLMSLGGGSALRANQGGKDGQIDNLLPEPDTRKPQDSQPVVMAPADTPEAEEDQTGQYFRGVKPALLAAIQDDTIHRPEEDPAWFNLLDVLRKNDQADIDAASTANVSYAQLFQQSTEYRGKLVTVTGTVQWVKRLKSAPNSLGFESVYQCGIASVDNPRAPLVACCLELPEGFPSGENLAENVKVTGFFFKRWAYRDKAAALRTAPTLLAKTFQWNQRPDMAPQSDAPNLSVFLVAIGAAVLTTIVLAVVMYRQMHPRRPRPGSAPSGRFLPPSGSPPENAGGSEKESTS